MNAQADWVTQETAAAKAKRRADHGIRRSAENAEDMDPGWNDRAIDLLRVYVRELGCDEKGPRRFLTENFVTWLTDRRERIPQEGRAFGAVMQRAARAGIVVKAGFGYATSSNLSPKVLWRAA